ncbi:MAG: TRAP transporter large permease subunit [Dehalococcoidales bacterium]|nr:TRAP transporter large permease subunit [Dehalococcoidales bacterium]
MNQVNEGMQPKVKTSPNALESLIRTLDKVAIFSRWTNVLGIAVLFLMVFVTFIDVVMRYIFNAPIKGVLELTEVLMIVAVFLGIAHTQNQKGHIRVDLLSAALTPGRRLVLEFITTVLGIGLFIVIIWRSIIKLLSFINVNAMHSQYFLVPDAPFSAILILGCICLCLLLIRDLLKLALEARSQLLGPFHWILMVGIPIILIIGAIFWMQPNLAQLSLPIIGLIGVIVSLILFIMAMPISFALILTSFLFIGHIRGSATALNMLGTEIFRTVGNYNWSVVAFFVMMGYLCFYARFGEDLFHAAYKWIGHYKGGMAVATIGACTGFAAIVGDSVSACATMGAVALPQMKRYGYDDRLSVGCITGGASLGPIIPPSVVFITYGLLTSMSIGDLFIAGFIPGVLIALCFIITIIVWCKMRPDAGPPGPRAGWGERAISLKAGGPVLILFIVVIGGIYTGIFTPTEGGSIGATAAFILALIMRRWKWNTFTQALLDTGKVVSMFFLIIVGGIMFTRFAAWCNLTGAISDLIAISGLTSSMYVIIVLVFLFIAGCFIDLMPLMMIGVPIFHPIAVSLGIDPLWFALLVCISINVGAFTPPVGLNMFVVKGLNPNISMKAIYSGSIPFVAGTVLAIIIMFAVPALITWLPYALK